VKDANKYAEVGF